jgi:hypothetical protein
MVFAGVPDKLQCDKDDNSYYWIINDPQLYRKLRGIYARDIITEPLQLDNENK